MVEGLADFPRPLQVARSDLQIAAREIDADGVAVDAVIGLGDRNVAAAAFQRDHQFDLMVHVLGQRRIGHGAAVRNDRIGGLGEIERRQPFVLPHLANVLDVIAADAPDPANRKNLVGAGHRDGSLRGGRDDVAAVGHDGLAVRYRCGWRKARLRDKCGPEKVGCAYQV